MSLPRNQRSNTSPATRLKAERLSVLNITARECTVEGDTNDYTVIFRGLSCSCPAGVVGMHCSHVQAGLAERARMNGFESIMFAHNQDHADSFAAMQRALGKGAIAHCEYGWHFVTYGKPVTPIAHPARPDHATLTAAANELLF